MTAVVTRQLTKCYRHVRALAGLDLSVPAGSIFGFLGPNGAGKTTALRILVGLLRPTSGEASVLGRRAWKDSPAIRRQVGYLPGDVRFHEWMTGAAFLAFCDRARGSGSREQIARLRERFDLDVNRRIRDYSRGMKQKLGLMQALMHRPALLILDEPTTALDPLMQQALFAELRAAAAEGRTVLFSSHTLSEVQSLCDRVAIIRRGRIVEDGTVADLRKRAVRRVEFQLKTGDASRLQFPPGLTAQPDHDGMVRGSWNGPVDRLLAWLASIDVEDATIEPPSLEDLFTAYYREEAGGAESPPAKGGGAG